FEGGGEALRGVRAAPVGGGQRDRVAAARAGRRGARQRARPVAVVGERDAAGQRARLRQRGVREAAGGDREGAAAPGGEGGGVPAGEGWRLLLAQRRGVGGGRAAAVGEDGPVLVPGVARGGGEAQRGAGGAGAIGEGAAAVGGH